MRNAIANDVKQREGQGGEEQGWVSLVPVTTSQLRESRGRSAGSYGSIGGPENAPARLPEHENVQKFSVYFFLKSKFMFSICSFFLLFPLSLYST